MSPTRFRPLALGHTARTASTTTTATAAVATQNCQSPTGNIVPTPAHCPLPIAHCLPYAITWYTTIALTYASPLIHASCSHAHFAPPASRAVTTSVGMHCIAST